MIDGHGTCLRTVHGSVIGASSPKVGIEVWQYTSWWLPKSRNMFAIRSQRIHGKDMILFWSYMDALIRKLRGQLN
jgi:hypothetical protein